MLIHTIAFLLFLAPVALAQQPTPILPDPKLTPGDAFAVTVQDLCVPGYSRKVRDVPAEMKREVYEEYGVTSHGTGDYEIDHLISLELGGSNSIKFLWPESHRTSPWKCLNNRANTCPKKKRSRKDTARERYRRMTMPVNNKLAHTIKDRVVQYFQLNASVLLVNFVDGSKMTITIAECNSPPLQDGARIRQISDDQTKLLFECEDDSILDVTIVDPGNAVILRDKNSRVEYLG
jgi:hypothetical protein